MGRFWAGVGIGVVAILIIIAAVGYFGVRNGLVPANADGKPGKLERWAAGTSLRATIARQMPRQPNPVALNDKNLLAGMKLYEA